MSMAAYMIIDGTEAALNAEQSTVHVPLPLFPDDEDEEPVFPDEDDEPVLPDDDEPVLPDDDEEPVLPDDDDDGVTPGG